MWESEGYVRPAIAGQTIRVYDSTGSKYVEFSHDGTNAKIDTSSGSIRLASADTFRIYDTGGTKYVEISHDGTDGKIDVSSGVCIFPDTISSLTGSHLSLNTKDSNKNIRLNSQTFTTDASIVGVQIKPGAGVAMTNGVVGLEVEPRVNDTFSGTSITGVFSGPWKRGTGAAGNMTGLMVAYEGKLQSDSGYSGTITGPVAVFRAINSLHGTVTTGPAVIYVHNHEGNVAWASFIHGTEALGTHSMTTATDKTGGAKSGTIKVNFNNTIYHIQLYAN